ncbi:unnamed protein product [Kuraishia capsulata CBS 1993]|uniref:Matrin-type domain-containing protein n=1 Tax=Kuraishia capsulata CBS 1993 TaxID=1382522 RepID=W6MRJ6_9ASCO|nr:uncharacterized protein KUCA_T00003846001 [Kuraishia capsulata CBS 1993]CDK27867.1 unnamed protein product [Kuraishia capsulata CBS 1993]
MPKYYCDYCKSYLTHDTMSVRKSHLMGKNHIKLYCEYYETEAKKLNIWEPSKLPYELTLEKLYNGIPGKRISAKKSWRGEAGVDIEMESEVDGFIPPPPTLAGLPNPPPSVYYYDAAEEKKKIQEVIKSHALEKQLPF